MAARWWQSSANTITLKKTAVPTLALLRPSLIFCDCSALLNFGELQKKNRTIGSLLNPKVEVNPVARIQGAEQRGEFGWRGRAGKGVPVARQPVTRGQPRAHCAQQARPARQRLEAAGFFFPPRAVPRTHPRGLGWQRATSKKQPRSTRASSDGGSPGRS